MSWEVNGINGHIDKRWDFCEHLNVGDIAPHWVGEQDSFGPVARYGMCVKCYEKHKEEQKEIEEICSDCGEEFPRSKVIFWKWYDFHAPQGDEPYIVCESCQQKEKHKERVRKDDIAYQREMQYYD
tara:strand:- start:121303 stop:121680 length:378 start_codon:yes stop_codon:yes gene_type:complete